VEGVRFSFSVPRSGWMNWPARARQLHPMSAARKFVFVGNRDSLGGIYVMNVDGSRLRRLTGNRGKDPAPAWSPDGRKIAFTGSGEDIYVINADGSSLRRITRSSQWDWAPVWSPAPKKR
jgi:Tol biopolymer transport system component